MVRCAKTNLVAGRSEKILHGQGSLNCPPLKYVNNLFTWKNRIELVARRCRPQPVDQRLHRLGSCDISKVGSGKRTSARGAHPWNARVRCQWQLPNLCDVGERHPLWKWSCQPQRQHDKCDTGRWLFPLSSASGCTIQEATGRNILLFGLRTLQVGWNKWASKNIV